MSIGKTTELSSVTTSQLVDGSVTSSKIAAGSVNSTHIGANAVVLGDIAAGAVGSAALADNAVVAAKIASGSVGSAALASNAVTLGKISNSAVDSAALADNAVVAAKIAAAVVGTAKLTSGSATNGQVLTADGSGNASFQTASGGGMVLISSVSAFASASPTSNLSFTNIPQTYTRLHLIGQFYVTTSGEVNININPSTVTSSIGGTTGFASTIYYINKTTDNGITTYGTGANNMEGSSGSAFVCTIPSMTNRWCMANIEINNYRASGPTGRVGFLSQQNAERFVGHGWGYASPGTDAPIRTLWVSGNFHIALFRLYGS